MHRRSPAVCQCQAEFFRQFGHCIAGNRREIRRHKQICRLRVDDRITHLIGCAATSHPDRVTFWPDVFTFVVETVPVFIDHNGEWHAVKTRDDSAVVFRRSAVDRNRVALCRVTHRLGALVQQVLQHNATIVRRSMNQEVSGCGLARASQSISLWNPPDAITTAFA